MFRTFGVKDRLPIEPQAPLQVCFRGEAAQAVGASGRWVFGFASANSMNRRQIISAGDVWRLLIGQAKGNSCHVPSHASEDLKPGETAV